MAYTPRRILKDHVYEICFRTKEGLPFPATETINTLLLGIMARANRDDKVKLCHFLWMSNHCHALVVASNPEVFCSYYNEVMKKVSESWKALFGLNSLNLWKQRISVIELIEREDVEDRIAYFYLNPAKANLNSNISKYPGLSSWHYFQNTKHRVDVTVSRRVKWYQYVSLPAIFSDSDAIMSDSAQLKAITSSASSTNETFVLTPNAWMKAFGIITSDEVKDINNRIKASIHARNAVFDAERRSSNTSTIGVAKLKSEQPTMTGWISSKNDPRIFVICSNLNLRIDYIKAFKEFCEHCAEARKNVLAGLKDIIWPQGAFVPWFSPLKYGFINACILSPDS